MTPIVLWVVLAWGVDTGYRTGFRRPPRIHHPDRAAVARLAGRRARHHQRSSARARRAALSPIGRQRSAAAHCAPGGRSAASSWRSYARARPTNLKRQVASDEAIGATTPQIRVGYQALSATGGQYVIEIDPRGLADLNQADLTGDIPPGLPVTRFVVSTNPGTAPDGKATQSGHSPTAPTIAAMPGVASAPPAAVDEDPSSWQPEVQRGWGQPSASNWIPPDPGDGAARSTG